MFRLSELEVHNSFFNITDENNKLKPRIREKKSLSALEKKFFIEDKN